MWFDTLSSDFLTIVLIFLVFVLLVRSLCRPTDLPPGPRPWPIIGNLLSLTGDVHESLSSLRRRYGDIFTLYLGSTPTVFVHGERNIREVLINRGEDFADRPKMFTATDLDKGKGVASRNGQIWKEQRRFTLHTLKNFGFGKTSLEEKLMEEVEAFIQCIEDRIGQTFSMDKLLHVSISNVICSLMFGKRFNHSDKEFLDYLKRIQENMEAAGFSGALNYLPWLKYLPGDLFCFHRSLRNRDYVDRFLLEQIKNHKETLVVDEPRDFIDAYLMEMLECQKSKDNTSFEEEQLLMVIRDMFVAGSETTATTLQWALLFLINTPDIQAKLRSEILSVIGPDRPPSLTDRKLMPFVEATLMEIQRCGDIVPLGVPHAAVRDTKLCGYNIPRGTTVFAPLCSLHKNPAYFKNPDSFDPTRFLDSEGKIVKSNFLLPFSAGKRVCPGESLAKMELFLFLTRMLQKFEFLPPQGVTSLPDTRVMGITFKPSPYNVRVRLCGN